MAFDEKLAERIRVSLAGLVDAEEKLMFGGVCFMVNGKMCIGVVREDMMCRIDPAFEKMALEKPGCRPMDFTGRPMKGYIYVAEEGLKKKADFDFWIKLCIDYNPSATAKKKKKAAR